MLSRREILQEMAAAAVAAGAEEAANSPAGQEGQRMTDSDVGSLYPFIQKQADRNLPSLSYLNARNRDLAAWKRRARGRLLELLHYSPPPCDPAPERIAVIEREGYRQKELRISTTPDIRVPLSLLIPTGLTRRAPGIVALHDHGGFYLWGREKLIESDDEHPVLRDFKRQYYGGRSIASALARQGYVVAVIDMFYWGERRLILDGDGEDWKTRPRSITPARIAAFNQRAGESEQLVARTIYAAGFTWPGVMFWDDVRTVDYLLTRPEVDPDRIGCVGLSVGGLRSAHLAALHDRIKAAVVVGWMTSFPRQLKKHVRWTIGHTKLVPGLYRHMDYPDVAALAMPAALLVINGSRDALFHPDGVRASFERLSACYAKAGIPERLRTRLYDTPHEFNPEMQAEAWEWLRRWLA